MDHAKSPRQRRPWHLRPSPKVLHFAQKGVVLTVLYIAHNDAAPRRRQGTPSSRRHNVARKVTDAGRRRGAPEDPRPARKGRHGQADCRMGPAPEPHTVHGLSDPMDYFRMAPEYSLADTELGIECPTFVC